ncbi:Cupin 2, conserved barrel domain protein [Metallosphaera sedula]|uniref:Cupin 2, conserved barrel domain protein n=3 Tax=Metallosphaera TaxID=41980 RepID=A4YGP4_METS5|nr:MULTISPECIES: DUF2249 domain-containing protein [Metallosphaera]ABP95596.1 Cupin 2, conserved barrel domain protein [Metallosphaera sedula DSM 5348]AIM27580.1 Cupin 2, conserved barrel domain protein [Metallosphaera sedula]AKV74440.1 cupin [Metallosphaera sedula]AKV76679.1 cupin [Metallosphaera sedula]AKV78930.1 cupin [Metallosphaera sedula]
MTTLDLREVDPPLRHKLVLETFHKMRPGEELEVIADHYPAHLLQLISGKIKKYEVKESGEGIFVLKLIKGGEEPRPIVSRLSDYRKSGETFTPIPVIRKDEYGAILVFFKPGQYIPIHAPDSDLIFYVIEGKGKAQIGENQVEIDKGSIVVVPKGVKRGITAETYMEALHVVVPAPSPEDHEKVMEAAARGIREVQLKG